MKLFLSVFFFSTFLLLTGCDSKTTVPELGEHSVDFKVFMEKRESGFTNLKDSRLGLIPSPIDNRHLLKQFISASNKLSVKNATDPAYDLRTHGRVTSVRDQGDCGSCWSFSAMSSLESSFLPGETNDFSENNLKNLHGFEWGECDGGNSDMAAAYFMRWSGPGNEIDDPYGEYDDTSPALSPVKHITDYYSVSSGSISSIKEAVVEFGAVDAGMYYNDTHMDFAANSYYYSGSLDINHGISIVGWDDNYSKANFNTSPTNDGAWIIKNSWGTGWGDSGYFYISYEDSKINTNCHAFKATDVEYENLYSHDPFGRTGWGGYGSETAWMSNLFTAGSDETLKAVSFYANSHSTAFEIRIYSGVTTNPTSGATLETTQTGTAEISGYNSVVLDSPVDLSAGTKFSVVIKVTTPENTYPVPLEMPVGGYASATASSGESFMAADSGGNPGAWLNIYDDYVANTNVNIKAYSIAQVVPIDLVINEIDYDQNSTDDAEFIEIYNKGGSSVNLSGMSLVLVSGADNLDYLTISLPDVDLAAGDYYVVCGDSANVANCDLDTSPDTNLIQNGSPDAVALFNGVDLIDTVSYEGDTAGYTETAGAGTDDPNLISSGISRYPNGVDTNDNSSDFSVRCITPGETNSANTGSCACGNGIVDVGEDCEPGDGVCCSASCKYEAVDVVCRAADGSCDKAEYCSGSEVDCPADDVEPATTECRASAGDCDQAEMCDGITKTCAEDTKLTTECRASQGACDAAEVCNGTDNDCPADTKLTTECRASAGICDVAETCNGVDNDCPADTKLTTECRAATGICDVAEVCDGVGNNCPTDGVADVDVECRGTAGVCDSVEMCNGTNKTCPADVKKTTECRVATGLCDVAEVCDGVEDDCPVDSVQPETYECRVSGGACDQAEMCDGATKTCAEDSKLTTECRPSAGDCDSAEVCNGVDNDCPVDSKLTTECRASEGDCDSAEVCNGVDNDCPVDTKLTTECRASEGDCDTAEVCNGIDNDCPVDTKLTTECRASEGICDVAETCNGTDNDCPVDLKLITECRAATGICDVAEVCDGAGNDCPVDGVADTDVECRGSAGVCDVVEMCNGTNKTCPADVKLTSECRASQGDCDSAETCNGTDNDCPADLKLVTECRASGGICDAAEVCNGVDNDCPADLKLVTECRVATGICDVAEVCDGVGNNCPADGVADVDVECRGTAGVCDSVEFCNGTNKTCPADEFVSVGTECREAAGECDVAETCSGIDADCPTDELVSDGEVCVGDGYPWTTYQCFSGTCESGDELYGSCIAPNEISVFPYSDTQDTTGRPDHVVSYGTDCDAIKGSGSDIGYELHVKAGYSYAININSTQDMAFAILNSCGDNEACFEAVDSNTTGDEFVEIIPETDAIYALIVETAGQTGEYTLTVTETELETPDEVEDADETVDEKVDETEDMDDEVVDETLDETEDETEDMDEDDFVDDMDNEIEDETVDETVDETDEEVADMDSTVVSDSEIDEDNLDTTPSNDEDEDYNKKNEGCSCSLII